MTKKIAISSISLAALSLPSIVFAGDPAAPAVNDFLGNPFPTALDINVPTILGGILMLIWAITVAAIIILFILAGFKFLTASGDTTKLAEARKSVLWGTAGVGVIVISFSIITLVRNFF